MLLEHILQKRNKILSSMEQCHADMVKKASDTLITWCARESFVVNDVCYQVRTMPRYIAVGDRAIEVDMGRLYLPIVEGNPKVLPVIDSRFAREVRSLKASGIRDGHVLIYADMFYHITDPAYDEQYSAHFDQWLRLKLFLSRIDETVRLAERYKNKDKFGPSVYDTEEGRIIDYGCGPILDTLIKRGLWKPLKGGGNGS